MSRHVWFRVITTLVLSIASLAAVQSLVQAQTGGVTMTVTPYLGGHAKYGEWLPLRVSLRNDGEDLNAEVRAVVAASEGQAVYAVPAPLPSGARKELVLYVLPPTFAQALDVRLVQGDQVIAETKGIPVTLHPQNEYLIGVVTSNKDAFAVLNGLDLPGRAQTRVVALSLPTLPERFEALRSFDLLILADVDTLDLAPAQGAALENWVKDGGRLLLGGGAAAQRVLSGLPAGLQVVQASEPVVLEDLQALGDYAGLPVQVPGPFLVSPPGDNSDGGAIPVVRQEGQPLLLQKVLGEGWVSYLALDPAASPFDAWSGALSFWHKLLSPGAAFPTNVPPDIPVRTLEAEQMNSALSNLPELDLPSVRWLGLLLGLYILMVGPVNFFLLRRWHRLAWAWVTIPALTVAFSLGSYGMGLRLRGSDVIVNLISIVPVGSGGQAAPVRTYVGIFSPTRQDYDIRVNDEALISPASSYVNQPWQSVYPSSSNEPLNVLQGNPVHVRSLGVNQWSMQSFRAETMVDLGSLELDTNLRIQGDQISGTLHNSLGHPLRDIVLISGTRYVRLGDLGAGETKEVDAMLGGGSGGSPFPYALFETSFQGPNGPPREVILRQSILEAYMHTAWGPAAPPADITLLAWTDLKPLDVALDGVRAAQMQTTLLVAPIPFAVEDGRVELPLGLLAGRMVAAEGESGDCGTGRGYIGNGRLTLEYQLPSTLRGVVPSSLTVKAAPVDGPMLELPEISLYDWNVEDWVLLKGLASGQEYAVSDAGRFVRPVDGMIRLQAWREDVNRTGGCYQFDVGLEGTLDAGRVDGEGRVQ
jgi:hypothetical protein